MLGKRLQRYGLWFVGLWMGLGPPSGGLVLLYQIHHRSWIDKYPWISVIAFLSIVGPLVVVAWLPRKPRKSERRRVQRASSKFGIAAVGRDDDRPDSKGGSKLIGKFAEPASAQHDPAMTDLLAEGIRQHLSRLRD